MIVRKSADLPLPTDAAEHFALHDIEVDTVVNHLGAEAVDQAANSDHRGIRLIASLEVHDFCPVRRLSCSY
jgi:hypothetical protein